MSDLALRKRLLHDAKNRALKRGLHFSLKLEHIQIPRFCPVFGIELKRTTGYPGPSSPTLDRIDNSIGYVPWNICVISYKANMLKRDGSLNEFRAIVQYMESRGPNLPDVPQGTLDSCADQAYNSPDATFRH